MSDLLAPKSPGGVNFRFRSRKDRVSTRRRDGSRRHARGLSSGSVKRRTSSASKRKSSQSPRSPTTPTAMSTAAAPTVIRKTGFFKGLALRLTSKKSRSKPTADIKPSHNSARDTAPVPTVVPPPSVEEPADSGTDELLATAKKPDQSQAQLPTIDSTLAKDAEAESVRDTQFSSVSSAAIALSMTAKRPPSIHEHAQANIPDPTSTQTSAPSSLPQFTSERRPTPDISPVSRPLGGKLTIFVEHLDFPSTSSLNSPRAIPLPPPTPGESVASSYSVLFPATEATATEPWDGVPTRLSPPSLVSDGNSSDGELLSPATPSVGDFGSQIHGRRSSVRTTEDTISEDGFGTEDEAGRSGVGLGITDGDQIHPLRSVSSSGAKKLSPLTIIPQSSSDALAKVDESPEEEKSANSIKFVVPPSPSSKDVPQTAKSEAFSGLPRGRASSLKVDGAGVKRSSTFSLFSRGSGPTRQRSLFSIGSSKKDKAAEATARRSVFAGNPVDQPGSRLPPNRSKTMTPIITVDTGSNRNSTSSPTSAFRTSISERFSGQKDASATSLPTRMPMTIDVRSYGAVGADLDNLRVKVAGEKTPNEGVVDEETKRLTECAFYA